jgi:hypothetical protein
VQTLHTGDKAAKEIETQYASQTSLIMKEFRAFKDIKALLACNFYVLF